MPTFTFTSPEGKQYTVNGPDGSTQEQAWGILQQQLKGHTDYGNPADSGTETYLDLPSMSFKKRPSSSFVAGVGQALQKVSEGTAQAVGLGPTMQKVSDWAKKVPVLRDTPLANANFSDERLANEAETDKPLNATTGGKAGNVAGSAALAAAAPEGLLGAIGGGAALSAAQPVTGNESRLANTAIGGATATLGYGAGKAVGAVAQPIVDRLNATYRGFRAILQQAGVPLDLAQSTGSKVATTLKNAANDSPLVSTRDFTDQQAAAFTRASLGHMGINGADEATTAVMQAGRQRLKDAYNAIAARNQILPDQQLSQDIQRIGIDSYRSLRQEDADIIAGHLQEIEDTLHNHGVINGDLYQHIQSDLGKIAKDGGKAPFVTEIRQALTGALQRQSSHGDAQLLAQTNQRYAAMKAIQQAIGDDNQVSPAKLYNALDTAKNANQTVYGQGPNQELINLAQAGKAILGKSTPNSGTAQRVAGMAALGSIGGALYDLASGKQVDPGHLAEGAVAAGFAPAAAKSLAYSPAGRRYLTQWAQSRIAAATRQGIGRAGQVLGAASAPSIVASQGGNQ